MAGSQEDARTGPKNRALAGFLTELGWSQSRLVAEVTAYMGRGYIGRSTVSEWVCRGRVPRDPLPTVVAHVLSNAAGRTITATDVWQDVGRQPSSWMPADHGLKIFGDYQSVISVAEDWIVNAGETVNSDRRNFMALSGATLTLPVWSYIENLPRQTSPKPLKTVSMAGSMKVTPSMAGVLESTNKEIEALEEREGGNGDNMRFVRDVFGTIAGYVAKDNFADDRTRHRVLTAWAHLCRIAGFIALDAGQHGLAQRYYFTGLQVTSTTGDSELGAHILSNLSYQAAQRGQPDAIQLAEAAMEIAARRGASLAIQAFTASRCALAQASMGNSYACRNAIDKAHRLLESPEALATRPQYLSWFNSTMLDTHSGHSLLALAQTTSRDTRGLIDSAENLLAPHMRGASDFRGEFSRDVLFWGSWLARGYVRCGELERAVNTGEALLDLIPSVHSHRVTTILQQLGSELTRHRGALRSPKIAEFLKNFNRSLVATTG